MDLHEFTEEVWDFWEAVDEDKRTITNLFNTMKAECSAVAKFF